MDLPIPEKYSGTPAKFENCTFVSKPNDLTAIGIVITTILKKFEG
ncbi:MAG: hypothetical protein A4E38_01315 [Methanoregulaceae archaeon PtaB.Bin108]|nr:MAG: hypothetical protein A4E38_01315 [Methanoregulaceae archaeon PtaB.Bin108]